MPDNKNKKKDTWDKLDVMGKLVSTVLLAAIVIVVKLGSDQISSSLATGNLVKSLISDLCIKEEKSRRDLALIALHRTVEPRRISWFSWLTRSEVSTQDHLVSDICERLIREDSTGKKLTEKDLWGSKPFKILEARDPIRAKELKDQIVQASVESVSEPKIRTTAISAPDPVPLKLPYPKPISTEATRLLSRVGANVVYIQFNGKEYQDLAEKMKNFLKGKGYVVPKVEKVIGNYDNRIRYFNGEDHQNALELSSSINKFLKDNKESQEITPKDFSDRFKAPQGQLEIWLNLKKQKKV